MPSGLEPRRNLISNGNSKYESLKDESGPTTDLPTAKKQKQEEDAETPKRLPKPKHTFKGIGNLVLAMKRFQAALNPRYEYGKQHSSGSLNQYQGRIMPSDGSGDEASTGPRMSQQHGQKAHLLFRKLPNLPDES